MEIKKGMLFNLGEENAYRVLEDYFKDKPYVVYKEVALNSVIDAEKDELSAREWSYYSRASFDFLICQADPPQPFELAVELDSAWHDKPDKVWKDELKDRLCDSVGLPLIRVRFPHVRKLEGVSFLRYMLDLHYGEKAILELKRQGKLDYDEEYFPGTMFDGTTKIIRRLMLRGVLPPAFLSVLGAKAEGQYSYNYKEDIRYPKSPAEKGTNIAWARVELVRGYARPTVVLEIEKEVRLKECSPRHNVLGIHGWFIAGQYVQFLCFQELERLIEKSGGAPLPKMVKK